MFSTSLFAFLYLAIQVSATPVVQANQPTGSLPFTKRFNLSSGQHLVQQGQARAKDFIQRGTASGHAAQAWAIIGVPVTNQATSYVASVGVGSPETKYELIIDTGSSNTWVGANTKYVKTSTSTDTGNTVSVTYGSGSFSGNEFTDQVVLGFGLVISEQSIGVATQSTGFNGVDGILGVGPTDLTVGTLLPDSSASIPTVTDSLFSQGTILSHELGVSFEPTNSPKVLNGELTWGWTDFTKFLGPITWIPLTGTSPANNYWGIDGAMDYGTSQILSHTAGIVDTGTTLILIATDAFQRYQSATGAVADSATGLLSITSAQFGNLQSIFFKAGESTFELTANAQIWPRNLNTEIGGTSSNIYLVISDAHSPSGAGLDFILGQAFLERFYSVYDTGNNRVGLAKTIFTDATTN